MVKIGETREKHPQEVENVVSFDAAAALRYSRSRLDSGFLCLFFFSHSLLDIPSRELEIEIKLENKTPARSLARQTDLIKTED